MSFGPTALPAAASSLFVLLLLLHEPPAASAAFNNGTPILRTFILPPRWVTDEPLDLRLVDLIDERPSSRVGLRNVTRGEAELSEAALLFLTGPVSTLFIPAFYSLVCVLSVPINIYAVLAFARGIRPKKPAAIYMLNLASADLLFAAMLPFKIFYHFHGNDWRLGSTMCRLVTAAFYWNMYCSVLLITCIAVDRLLAVVYPIQSLTWRRPKNAVLACVIMWILSLAGSAPLVISEQTVFLRQLNITTCHDVQQVQNIAWLKLYFLVLCCVLFFLPLLVTLASYTRVIWSLCRAPEGVTGSAHRRRRAVVMALTVLVIFLLCFMPTNCLLLAHYLFFLVGGAETGGDAPDGSYAAYLVFLCVGSLNCLLDPLVYYFGSSQCQRQLSNVLGCRGNPKRNAMGHSASDSRRSSSRTFLNSSRTESSKISSSVGGAEPTRENGSSLYRKLLV